VLALGVHRPGSDDLEAGVDERRGQRVPGVHLLVGEHHRQHAVGPEQAAALAEGSRHLALVVLAGQLAGAAAQPGEAGRVGHRLVLLACQRGGEPLWIVVPECPLEPNVEEVGELGVLDVVVVGRVDADQVDGVVREMREAAGVSLGDTEPLDRRATGALPERETGRLGQPGDAAIGVDHLVDGPVEPLAGGHHRHLGMTPLHAEVVAVERALHHAARDIQPAHPRVVVRQLVDGERQVGDDGAGAVGRQFRLDLRLQRAQRLHRGTERQELAGGEEVAPAGHAIEAVTSVVVTHLRDLLVGHEAAGQPAWEAAGQLGLGRRRGRQVGLGRCTELDALRGLDDDGVELLAHAAGLRLALDVVAVDHLARPGGDGHAAADGARLGGALGRGAGDDLEAAGRPGGVDEEADGDAAAIVALEPPVGGEGDRLAGLRAGHRPRPEVPIEYPSLRMGEEGLKL